MKSLTSFFFIFLSSTFLYAQTNTTTSGDNSPAIIAKNLSVTYGVRPDAIEAILWIYTDKGYDEERRKRATEQILKIYANSPEKKQKKDKLSGNSIDTMNIYNIPEISSALEWDLFATNHYISTTGHNSPAVMAKGNVNIWYGISPKTLHALSKQLEKNKVDIVNFETKLEQQVKKYKNLTIELEFYSKKEQIYKQAEVLLEKEQIYKRAKVLLEEGKLKEAEQLIESDFFDSKKRQAYKGYIFGKIKELNLKYDTAAIGYKNAIDNDENNPIYHIHYANNESTLAHYDEAIKHYEIALRINTSKEKKATLLNNLGVALISKEDYDKAIKHFEEALKIDLKAFGNKHPIIANRYNNFGSVLKVKGKYDKAAKYFEEALKIGTKVFGEEHPRLITYYNNLGTSLDSKGDHNKAITYYEKALKISLELNEKVFSRKFIYLSACYNNLGHVWHSKKNYDKAIEYYKKALNIDLKLFGDKHTNIANRYNNLGNALESKKEYDKAIRYFEQSLNICRIFFGEKHAKTAKVYNSLGVVWGSKGEYTKAIEYYKNALQINLSIFGKEHPNIATNYNNLGFAHNAKKEHGKAVKYYDSCLVILSKFFKPTHIYPKGTAKNLSHAAYNKGMELYKEKKYQKAIGYLQKSLENTKMTENILLFLNCLNSIGATQKHLKKYDEGLQSLNEGLQKATRLGVNNPPLIRRMQYHKVGCLKGLKRKKEAKALAEQLWEEGSKANDKRLLEDLKKDWRKFKHKKME